MQHKEISKARVGKYALLRHKKHRENEGLFLIQGKKAVEDALGSFEIEAVIENENDIRKISTLESLPEVIAVCRIPRRNNPLRPSKGEFLLALDGIQDPGNLGTIIRTAHWFGIRKIFCSKNTVDLYNPKVVQSTMGSISKVEVEYCDLDQLFDTHSDIPVYGLLMNGDNLFLQHELVPGFLLMGSEGHGPAQGTLRRVTRSLTIPPANPSDKPDSLNVAIAAAITISQLLK